MTQLSSSDYAFVSATGSSMTMAGLTAPTISLAGSTSSAAGGLTNANQLTLTGTAQAGVTIKIFDQTAQIGVATADGNGIWSFATSALTDGSHSFMALATDGAGDVGGVSSSLTITIDATAPNAPSIATFSPDTSILGDSITSANPLTLTGTAEAGSKVLVFDGATQVGTATVDAGGSWSFATGTLVDGAHAFTGQAVDAAGNVSVTSGALNVTVDTVAPNAPVLVSDTLAASNKMVVSGTAEAGSTIKLYEGTTLLGTAVTATNGAWSVTTGSLAAGTHAFTAVATDAAGNSSDLSAVFDPVVGTLIESAGATSLTIVGSNYHLSTAGTDLLLKYGGLAYVAGQFNGWAAIGAETILGGYEVAWKNTFTGMYTLWKTDTNGNFASYLLSNVAGTNTSLESGEMILHQDLNGDGTIGLLAPNKVLEFKGTTSLVQVDDNFYLFSKTTGVGPQLKFGGLPVLASQRTFTPALGAEQTSTGYTVVWKISSTDYSIWTTDSNGNETSYVHASGTSTALESLETTFQQDLNGDGSIGVVASQMTLAPPTTVIESQGKTSLVQMGDNFDLFDGTGTGPELKYGGLPVLASQRVTTPALGAEQTATGYTVVWKVGADEYSIWNTDKNGNETSYVHVSGSDGALKALEPSFLQDLNGDGVINTPSTVLDISGKTTLALNNMSQVAKIELGAALELTGAVSGSVTFAAVTGTLVLDHSTQFTGAIYGLSGNGDPSSSDILDLKDISFGTGTKVAYSGDTSGGILTVADAQNHTAQIKLVGDYTHSTFNLSSDGNGGTLVIDPPVDQFNFSFAKASTPAPIHAAVAGDAFVFTGTAVAGPVQLLISTDLARDQASLTANHIEANYDHAQEQGVPHIEFTSHIGPTDPHGYLLHA